MPTRKKSPPTPYKYKNGSQVCVIDGILSLRLKVEYNCPKLRKDIFTCKSKDYSIFEYAFIPPRTLTALKPFSTKIAVALLERFPERQTTAI